MKKGKIPEWLKLDRAARRKIEIADSVPIYDPSVVHKTSKKDVEEKICNTIKPHEVDEDETTNNE